MSRAGLPYRYKCYIQLYLLKRTVYPIPIPFSFSFPFSFPFSSLFPIPFSYPSPFPPTSSSSSVFRSKVDFTIFFRELAVAASQEDSNDALLVLEPSFYEPCFTKKVLVSRLISPSICLYINVIFPVPISYFFCLSVSVCLSIYLSIYLSLLLSSFLTIYQSINLFLNVSFLIVSFSSYRLHPMQTAGMLHCPMY